MWIMHRALEGGNRSLCQLGPSLQLDRMQLQSLSQLGLVEQLGRCMHVRSPMYVKGLIPSA